MRLHELLVAGPRSGEPRRDLKELLKVLDAIPRLPTGKLVRRALRERAAPTG